MNRESIIGELHKLKDNIKVINYTIDLLIEEVSKCDELEVANKGYIFNVIKKFVKENGCLLNKDLQTKLSTKLWVANGKESLTIISACKMCDIKYEYCGDNEWKDIKLNL